MPGPASQPGCFSHVRNYSQCSKHMGGGSCPGNGGQLSLAGFLRWGQLEACGERQDSELLLDNIHRKTAVPQFPFSSSSFLYPSFSLPFSPPALLPIPLTSCLFLSLCVCGESQIHNSTIMIIFWFQTVDSGPVLPAYLPATSFYLHYFLKDKRTNLFPLASASVASLLL